jgi:hypothetical protein
VQLRKLHRAAPGRRVNGISKKKLLLASQRIEVGALLDGTTLNPSDFHWGVADSETTSGAQVTRLEYAAGHTPAYFQFDRYLHQHYALYSWGDGEELEEHFVGTWPHQVLHLARWIARLEHQARTREHLVP